MEIWNAIDLFIC